MKGPLAVYLEMNDLTGFLSAYLGADQQAFSATLRVLRDRIGNNQVTLAHMPDATGSVSLHYGNKTTDMYLGRAWGRGDHATLSLSNELNYDTRTCNRGIVDHDCDDYDAWCQMCEDSDNYCRTHETYH